MLDTMFLSWYLQRRRKTKQPVLSYYIITWWEKFYCGVGKGRTPENSGMRLYLFIWQSSLYNAIEIYKITNHVTLCSQSTSGSARWCRIGNQLESAVVASRVLDRSPQGKANCTEPGMIIEQGSRGIYRNYLVKKYDKSVIIIDNHYCF